MKKFSLKIKYIDKSPKGSCCVDLIIALAAVLELGLLLAHYI